MHRHGLLEQPFLFDDVARWLLLLFQYTFVNQTLQPCLRLRIGYIQRCSDVRVFNWRTQKLLNRSAHDCEEHFGRGRFRLWSFLGVNRGKDDTLGWQQVIEIYDTALIGGTTLRQERTNFRSFDICANLPSLFSFD